MRRIFLRIPESENPLDNTGVHPEAYDATKKLLESIGYNLKDLKDKSISNISSYIEDVSKTAEVLGLGVPTLKDIIKELEKPGSDPREEMPAPVLRSDVLRNGRP